MILQSNTLPTRYNLRSSRIQTFAEVMGSEYIGNWIVLQSTHCLHQETLQAVKKQYAVEPTGDLARMSEE